MGINRMTGTSWQVEKARSKDSIYRKKCVNCIHYSLGWCREHDCSITLNHASICKTFENIYGENPKPITRKKRVKKNTKQMERKAQFRYDMKYHPEKFKIIKVNDELNGRKNNATKVTSTKFKSRPVVNKNVNLKKKKDAEETTNVQIKYGWSKINSKKIIKKNDTIMLSVDKRCENCGNLFYEVLEINEDEYTIFCTSCKKNKTISSIDLQKNGLILEAKNNNFI